MLARLDSITGVVRSFADRSGTLIRITMASDANADKVLEDVLGVLSEEGAENPSRLSVAELNSAIRGEEWRDSARIRELSVIELRTLILRGLALLAVVSMVVALVIRWWRSRTRSLSSS